MLADNLPELLDFSKELGGLEPASKVILVEFAVLINKSVFWFHFLLLSFQIQLKYLNEELQAIKTGLVKSSAERKASKKDGHGSKHFCRV